MSLQLLKEEVQQAKVRTQVKIWLLLKLLILKQQEIL